MDTSYSVYSQCVIDITDAYKLCTPNLVQGNMRLTADMNDALASLIRKSFIVRQAIMRRCGT